MENALKRKTRFCCGFFFAVIMSIIAANAGAETVAETNLLQLARAHFQNDLSATEEKMFRATANGHELKCVTGSEIEDNPTNALNWPRERTIRSDRLAWLCTDSAASALITYRGIQISGIRIDGELDLDLAEIKFPLSIIKCAFKDDLNLRLTHLFALNLDGTCIKNLNGTGLMVEKVLYLRRGFRAEGQVNIPMATIGNNLECTDGQFINPNGVALCFENSKIGGCVKLDGKFKSEGEVRFLNATIGLDLSCTGGEFINPNGKALAADGVKIGGAFFLSNPKANIKTDGEIRFPDAIIEENLECGGGQFTNFNGVALNAARAKIQGSVFLDYGLKAEGEVSFSAATIEGDFNCEGGHFLNYNNYAISADEVKIAGSVLLRNDFKAEGRLEFTSANVGMRLIIQNINLPTEIILDLRSANVGTLFDNKNSWPKSGNLLLNNFTYTEIDSEAPNDADNRIYWLHLQPQDHFYPQPYEQLAGVLHKMGYEDEAAKVMIAKNEDYAKRLPWNSISRLWYGFIGSLAGYGYLPGRAFKISIAFISFGTFFFFQQYRRGFFKSPDGRIKRNSFIYSMGMALAYSLETFVPFLKLAVAENWKPANHFLWGYFLIHRIAGWILTTLWIGALTGLVKT